MSPLRPRRSRAALPRHALVVALLAAISMSSCGGADTTERPKRGPWGEGRVPEEGRGLPRLGGRGVAGEWGHRARSSYDDAAPYWNGIVRIGELDGDMAAVKRLPEGAHVTIEPTG